MDFVPSSRSLISPMIFRNPRIRPPTMMAGMIGANISARFATPLCRRFILPLAAAFTSCLSTPSILLILENSSKKTDTLLPIITWNWPPCVKLPFTEGNSSIFFTSAFFSSARTKRILVAQWVKETTFSFPPINSNSFSASFENSAILPIPPILK